MRKYRTLLPKPTNPFQPTGPIRLPTSFQAAGSSHAAGGSQAAGSSQAAESSRAAEGFIDAGNSQAAGSSHEDGPVRIPTPFQATASSQATSHTEFFRRERCGIENCKTRLYYEENGLTFCKNGHHQQGEIATQQDEDDLLGKKTTTHAKTQRRKKGTRTASGRKAFELYVLSYQLILRKQCWALIHDKGFPEELEGIVRDLWALRLPIIKHQAPEPVDSDSESQILFSSQSDTENESADARDRREKGLPTLMDTLSLCYMGMILLRLPIRLGDLHRWAVREEVPYVLPLRHVPQRMRAQLPTKYLNALTMRTPLGPDKLHRSVYQLAALYNHQYGLELPPLNFRPLLYKYIHQLALPLDSYIAVQHIATRLDYNFAFPPIRHRQSHSALPEIQLLSLLVIVVKLYHPFDSTLRYARSPNDLGFLAIDWSTWATTYESHMLHLRDCKPLEPGTEMNVTEHDALNMSDEVIDHYLDWYERTWLDLERRDTNTHHPIAQDLLDMFPTSRADTPALPSIKEKENAEAAELKAAHEKLLQAQKRLVTRGIVTEESEVNETEPVKRIGADYKRYRMEGDLPANAKIFYGAAAKIAGISVRTLVMTVFKMERMIMKWRKASLRAESEEAEEAGSA